jgi:FkbM family methyltransferase
MKSLSNPLNSQPIRVGENAEDVLSFVKPYLPNNPIIVEAGGRDGIDTIKMARFWPRSIVYTFEPVPELYEIISSKIKRFSRIKAYPLALAEKNGTSRFYLSEYWRSLGTVSGSSSLLQPKEHLIYDHSVIFPRSMKVETRKLDDWASENEISKIDFLWLDMQGYELNMLKASELGKKAKAIYIEVSFVEAYQGQYLYEDVKRWMHDHGFSLAAVDFDEDSIASELMKTNRYFGNAIFIRSNESS